MPQRGDPTSAWPRNQEQSLRKQCCRSWRHVRDELTFRAAALSRELSCISDFDEFTRVGDSFAVEAASGVSPPLPSPSPHRAAIGISEETDAAVVVVSEEEGKISLVREGKITRDLDAGTLRATLAQLSLQ